MGACFEVYKEKGAGSSETVYQECLQYEFVLHASPFQPKLELSLAYKGRTLICKFIPDFVCFREIILELKAVSAICDEHRAQVHNYFKATGFRLGLLVNFGHYPQIEYERIVR
jgi:GxxExxY protein